MSIEQSELRKIAELARLRLSEGEAERLIRDCEAILNYFEAIREVESEDGATTAGSERTAPLREDRADCDPLRSPLSEMAPAWRDGYFVLPRLPAMDVETEGES
jgi:aspartyl-tRNA(Asn)/glutamyl-tRNA(Gln) amidotransferase subunit C